MGANLRPVVYVVTIYDPQLIIPARPIAVCNTREAAERAMTNATAVDKVNKAEQYKYLIYTCKVES